MVGKLLGEGGQAAYPLYLHPFTTDKLARDWPPIFSHSHLIPRVIDFQALFCGRAPVWGAPCRTPCLQPLSWLASVQL